MKSLAPYLLASLDLSNEAWFRSIWHARTMLGALEHA
jgi:hypothetical protein